jgi:hypothetical protein
LPYDHRIPMSTNPITSDMDSEDASALEATGTVGAVTAVARRYTTASDQLLGFVLHLSYEELRFVTCDPWKRKCGGVPRNSFILVKLGESAVSPADRIFCNRLVLARVTESVPTPVETEVQNTVFQIHKLQPIVDPITQKELQWSALKAGILGTYYDASSSDKPNAIAFGNDVDTYFSPLAYEVYVPTDSDLEALVNSFVAGPQAFEVGHLRYTETPSPLQAGVRVPVRVSVTDFIGSEHGVRTAFFGKTRFGKSNSIKIIADTILRANPRPGQVIFDPSGEYTYFNQQDRTSLFMLHAANCARYSLDPGRQLPPEETAAGLVQPLPLRINFYDDVAVGHSIIAQLFAVQFGRTPPNYMQPILNWTPPDSPDNAPQITADQSAYWHFWRTLALWYGCLRLADYDPPDREVPMNLRAPAKNQLLAEPDLQGHIRQLNDNASSLRVPIASLPIVCRKLSELWDANKNNATMFPPSNGNPYFNDVEEQMLRILKNDGTISGRTYLTPFRTYHDLNGSNLFRDIAAHAENRRTVFVDFARADEQIRSNLSRRICRTILDRMMTRFANGTLGDLFVVLYFEEAHTLFRKDDNDLNDIYNKLAKEGAKFHISMAYATQSMSTLSPDLVKNTENFFIGHLDDDREVREVTHKRAFRDIAEDVERIQSKGYVRMLTASHRFALPVQVRKFEAPPN